MGHASPPPQVHPTLCAKTLGSSTPEIKMGGAGGAATSLPLLTWAPGLAQAALHGPGLWVLRLGRIALRSSQASLCWLAHHLPPPARKPLLQTPAPPPPFSLPTDFSLFSPSLATSPTAVSLFSPTLCPQFSLTPHLGSLPSCLACYPFPPLSLDSFSFGALL